MPRKAKEKIDEVKEEKVKKEPSSKKVANKKTSTPTKKTTSKRETKTVVNAKTTPSKKSEKVSKKESKEKTTKATKKDTLTKTSSNSKKKTTVEKKATTKKTTSAKRTSTKKVEPKSTKAKKTTAKKATTKKATSKKESVKKKQSEKKVEIIEYYDLPYRYNQTVVKVLAQTPNILFVYWDISDVDKQNYINQYGEYFFNDTKPVLIVYNDTLHYSFEIDINDFANSWYLHINDANCDYRVELGRRPINQYAKIENYLYISSSNEMDSPNDHILFDSLNNNVYFKNIKTNVITEKNISLYFLSKIGKLYNVKEFYKTLYKDENIDFEKLNLKNMPSS